MRRDRRKTRSGNQFTRTETAATDEMVTAAASGTDGRTASTVAAEMTDGTTGEMIEGRTNVMSAETGIGSETERLGRAGKREMGEVGTCETEQKLPVEKMLKRVVMGRVETEFRRRRNDDEPSS